MNIHTFRASLGPRSLAKANRFRVTIAPGSGGFAWNPTFLRNFELMASDALMAGRMLEVETYRYYGPDFDAPIQSKANDFSISFYNQDNMQETKFFHSWMDYIHGSGSYDFRWMAEYVTTIKIEKLSEVEGAGVQSSITYKKAYPVSIQDIPFAWADDEVLKSTVNFTYVDYDIA